jgi:hypothetical protein
MVDNQKHFIILINNIALNYRTLPFYFPKKNYFKDDYALKIENIK